MISQGGGALISDVERSLVIRRVDAIAVKVPLEKPMVMALERVDLAENLVVRIEAENGVVGWGEATVAPTMTGDTLAGMVAAVREKMISILQNANAMERADLARRCRNSIEHNSGAKAAIEIALLDLLGRHLNVSAVDLVGGALRQKVEPMWLLGNSVVAEDISEAEKKISEGYHFFKLKVGVKAVEEEIEAAHAIRKQVGPDVRLCADANAGWSAREALQYARSTVEVGLEFLEQPLPNRELAAMRTVNQQNLLPICGDECISHTGDILTLGQNQTIAGANLKIIKAGGVTPLLEAASLCARLGLSVTLAGKVAGTSISAAATLLTACASPVVDWGVNLTHVYLADDVVRDPILIKDGTVRMRQGPGLGIDVDEDAIDRFSVS